jgi:hypothetical protein
MERSDACVPLIEGETIIEANGALSLCRGEGRPGIAMLAAVWVPQDPRFPMRSSKSGDYPVITLMNFAASKSRFSNDNSISYDNLSLKVWYFRYLRV